MEPVQDGGRHHAQLRSRGKWRDTSPSPVFDDEQNVPVEQYGELGRKTQKIPYRGWVTEGRVLPKCDTVVELFNT